MNVNYNPIFIFPEFNLTKKASYFFKLLITFQIASIIIIAIFFYPMELMFLYNLLMKNYQLSTADINATNQFKQLIANINSATLSCDSNNNLIINGNINALDIDNNNISCSTQIKVLYGIN
jgi:hypothetical protein